jgi:hypothetical protein
LVGMGDRFKENKLQYSPVGKPIRCDISGIYFHPCAIRECHDEAVARRYGVGGIAHVSIWVCRKCRHKIEYKYHGGVGCELDIPEGKKGNVGRYR